MYPEGGRLNRQMTSSITQGAKYAFWRPTNQRAELLGAHGAQHRCELFAGDGAVAVGVPLAEESTISLNCLRIQRFAEGHQLVFTDHLIHEGNEKIG